MKAEDLQQVRPGFHDAALGSQAPIPRQFQPCRNQ